MTRRKAAPLLSLLAVIAAAALIFFFSSQEGQESSRLSGRVTRFVLSLIAPGFTELSAAEQLREIQLKLMGKVQLEVLQEIVRRRFGMDVEFSEEADRKLPTPLPMPKQLYKRAAVRIAARGSYQAIVSFLLMLEKEFPLVSLQA